MNVCLFTKKQSEVIRLQTEVTELTEAPINAYNRYPRKVYSYSSFVKIKNMLDFQRSQAQSNDALHRDQDKCFHPHFGQFLGLH